VCMCPSSFRHAIGRKVFFFVLSSKIVHSFSINHWMIGHGPLLFLFLSVTIDLNRSLSKIEMPFRLPWLFSTTETASTFIYFIVVDISLKECVIVCTDYHRVRERVCHCERKPLK
jgi:hypothetical protein